MKPSGELRAVVTEGNIDAFLTMLENDPLLLEKATLSPLTENILHTASVSGNLDFVRLILDLKPGFAWDGNKDGLTPLHMASALGRDEVVRVLLEVGQADLCLLQDNQGMTPLHYAAVNGKIPVIEKLLLKCPTALEIETSRSDTALHLALKNKQADAFRRLVQGLGEDRRLILKHRTSIEQLAKETNQLNQLQELNVLDASPTSFRVRMPFTYSIDPQLAQVVASLIATVTFQAIVNPPPAIWYKDMKMDYKCLYQGRGRSSPPSINRSADCPALAYIFFVFFNAVGFLSSVMGLLFFGAGWVGELPIAMSLSALLLSYIVVLFAMFPDANASPMTLLASLILVLVVVMFSIR